MIIEKLQVNHLREPLGYRMDRPGFSWIVTGSKGRKQTAARVEIALEPQFQEVLFDSGRQEEISSLGYYPEINLTPYTRYYWRVTVWDDVQESGTSEPSWFETAKMEDGWQAKWITPPFEKEVHPLFCRSFAVRGKVLRARAYACGLGVFDLYVNGTKAGDEVLAPFYNDYNHWLQYITYDITGHLTEGENVAAASLGNGWFKGRFGFIDGLDELYGDRFLFLCEIRIYYEDGSIQIVGSDNSWLCHPSPVLKSSIYDGEVYDAAQEVAGFGTPEAVMEDFVPALVSRYAVEKGYYELLQERLSSPLRVMERIRPKQLLLTPAGEQVIDFGQIMTGWFVFRCNEEKGQRIRISCGEILQDGCFYNENLRTAREEFIYYSNGRERMVQPHFTFYGFRYLKVEGMSEISPEDFEGWVIYSDLEETGEIITSDEKVNRLILNTKWGQKGNFVDVPTDCPQRDERMGWTGDAQIFAATACFHMDTQAFYHKYLHDMLQEQKELGGAVPHVVPDILGQILRRDHQPNNQFGSCAWGDAACVIPWTLYLFYGDKEQLRRHYPNMKLWVDYIRSVDETFCGGGRLWKHGFHFADWLALDNPGAKDCMGATDPYYVASAYYFYSAGLAARAAGVLGYEDDEVCYGKLSEEVKEAICREYFKEDGSLAIDTQTAHVLALYLGFAPEKSREGLIRRLSDKLEENGIHLDTGSTGTPYLCPALSEGGMDALAYSLLLQEEYPSWLYEVNMGATTVWERWNSVLSDGHISDTGMNSLNHYAYGSIAEWVYRYVCGLNPREEGAGFKKTLIAPRPDRRLGDVSMRYRSAAGTYRSGWEWNGDRIMFTAEIPFDAQALWVLPAGFNEAELDGRRFEGGSVLLETGKYVITAVRDAMPDNRSVTSGS